MSAGAGMLRVGVLPTDPLDACSHFYAAVLPRIRDALAQGGDCVLLFDPADHTHREWRLGVVHGLARQYAPVRVNAIAGDDPKAIAAALAYLSRAPGVTGQLLPVAGTDAGAMLSSQG